MKRGIRNISPKIPTKKLIGVVKNTTHPPIALYKSNSDGFF